MRVEQYNLTQIIYEPMVFCLLSDNIIFFSRACVIRCKNVHCNHSTRNGQVQDHLITWITCECRRMRFFFAAASILILPSTFISRTTKKLNRISIKEQSQQILHIQKKKNNLITRSVNSSFHLLSRSLLRFIACRYLYYQFHWSFRYWNRFFFYHSNSIIFDQSNSLFNSASLNFTKTWMMSCGSWACSVI